MTAKKLLYIAVDKPQSTVDDQRRRLLSLSRKDSHPDKEKILNYLKDGNWISNFWGRSVDFLAPYTHVIERGTYVYTDGVWMWEGKLPYYVHNYNITLPLQFLNHMKKNKWKVRKDLPKSLMNLPIKTIYL